MDRKLIEFAKLVEKMRRAQKTYFRERTDGALQESKRLERQVDVQAEEIIQAAEPRLFRE